MADTTLPAVTQEVTPPTLLMADGQPTATSLQVAEHFGKRHTHVLRAIRNLAAELPDEHKPIFGLMSQSVEVGQGGLRRQRRHTGSDLTPEVVSGPLLSRAINVIHSYDTNGCGGRVHALHSAHPARDTGLTAR